MYTNRYKLECDLYIERRLKMDPYEFSEALIKEVKKHELLYNKNHPHYLPTAENLKCSYKVKTWEAIANKLNKSVDDCKTRWKTLRDTYIRINKANNWTEDLDQYERWQHFKSLAFLREHVIKLNPVNNSNSKRKRSATEECMVDSILNESVFVIDDEDETAMISQENKRRKIESDISLSIKTKLYIIRLLVEGEDSVDIAKKFDVTMKTITSIYENAEDLRNNIEAKKIMELEDKKMQKMETLLTTWVSDMNSKHSPLSTEMIKNKAISIYNDLEENPNGVDDHVKFFQARDKWFEEWFKKHPEIHDTKLLDDITDNYVTLNNERKSTEIINVNDEFILKEEEIPIPDDETFEIDPLTDIVEDQSEMLTNQSKKEQIIENKMNPEKEEIIIVDEKNSENDESLKKKKTRVDLENQLQIIQLLDKGSKVSDVAKIFDLPQCVIEKILQKNANNLRNLAAKSNKQLDTKSSILSDNLVKKMEEELLAWILELNKKTWISISIIQRKARCLFAELNKNSKNWKKLNSSMCFNLEWFSGFQKRFDLKLDKHTNTWVRTSSPNNESLTQKEIITLIDDEDILDVTDNINVSMDDQMFVNKENKKNKKDSEEEEYSDDQVNSKNKLKPLNKEDTNKTFEIKNKTDLMLRLEELLSDWITDMFGKGLVIGSRHIRYKAETLFNEIKESSSNLEVKVIEFPRTNSWFKNFQKRCDIHFDNQKNTWFQKNKYKPNIENIPFFEDEISIINLPVDDIFTDSMDYESQMSINVNGKEEEMNVQNSSCQNNVIDDQSQIIVDKKKIKEENIGTDEISVNGENHISFNEVENGKPNSEYEMNLKNEQNNSPEKGNKLKSLSSNTKFEIIQLIEKGIKPLDISKTFNVSISTVYYTYRTADKIICDYISTESNLLLDNDRKLRLELIQRTEESLTIWIIDMNRKQRKIYKEDVQKEALRIFNDLKENSNNSQDPKLIFFPINFWFSNYKTRFSISETSENDIIFDPLIDTDSNNMDYQGQIYDEDTEDDNAKNQEEEFYVENQPFIISEENLNSKSEDFLMEDCFPQSEKDEIGYIIPLNIKLEVIELFGIGKPLPYIAKKFNLSQSTVLEIYKNFNKVCNYSEDGEKCIKVQSDLTFKMEAELIDWINNSKSSLSETAVKCKAKRVFEDLKRNSKNPEDLREIFVANKAWFKSFIERSNLNNAGFNTGLTLTSLPPMIISPETRRDQTSLQQQMEKLLITWIHDMKKQNSPVNKHTIKNKAKSILFHLQQNSSNSKITKLKFIVSEYWFRNFVKRSGINQYIADDIPAPSKIIVTTLQSDLIQRMETLLAAWIFDMNSNNLPMSLKIIQDKAISLYNDLKNDLNNSKSYIEATFDASSIWFEGFKNRYCLQNVKLLEDTSNADLNMGNKIDSTNLLNTKEKPLSNKELISLFQDEPSFDAVSISSSNYMGEQNEMNIEMNKSSCEDTEEDKKEDKEEDIAENKEEEEEEDKEEEDKEEEEEEVEEEEENIVHEINDDNQTTITSPEITNTSNNSEENYYYYLKKKTRKYNISLRSKVKILELLDKGLKRPLICKQLGLPMSTVCYVSHNANKIRERIKSGTDNTTEFKSMGRSFLLQKVEKLLIAWILDINEKHLKLNSRSIKAKAISLFNVLKKHLNYSTEETFTASYGWFTSFRQRSGIEITLCRKNVDFDVKEYSSTVSSNLKPLSNEELILLYLEDKNANDENNEEQGVITIEDDDEEGEIEELELEEEDELELEEQLALDEENEYDFEYKKFEEEEDLKIKEEDLKIKENDLKQKDEYSKMKEEVLKQEEEPENDQTEKSEDYTTNTNNSEINSIQLESNRVNFEEDFVRFLKTSELKNNRTFIPFKLKTKIIELLDNGETVANIASELKLEESIIMTLKDEIDKLPNNNTENQSDLIQKMEKLLLAWISDINSKNLQLTSRMVQEKAKSLFNYLKEKSKNLEDSKQVFTGGYNWLEGFKKRYSVTIDYVNEVDSKKQQPTSSISPTITLNNIEKRPRTAISFKQKLDIIQLLDKGNKAAHIARQVGLPETTVRTIYKNADKIRNNIAAGSVLSCEATTKIRSSLMQRMEKLLTSWIFDINNKNLPISSRIIQEKARSLFNDLKESSRMPEDAQQTFNASYGWFERFKKRSGLQSIKLLSEVENIEGDDSSCTGNLNIKDQPLSNEELILIYGEDVASITDTTNGSIEENQIINLDDDNDENEQQNVVILDESSDEESELNFPLEKLTEALKDLDHAVEIFQKYDKNKNRSKSARSLILEAVEYYRDLLHVKEKDNFKRNKISNHKNRISIDGEVSQNHIEICNLPTE